VPRTKTLIRSSPFLTRTQMRSRATPSARAAGRLAPQRDCACMTYDGRRRSGAALEIRGHESHDGRRQLDTAGDWNAISHAGKEVRRSNQPAEVLRMNVRTNGWRREFGGGLLSRLKCTCLQGRKAGAPPYRVKRPADTV
jgi:hypothetical protein